MGMMHGRGLLKTKAGTYDGMFENNEMHGPGSFTTADGAKFTGTFEHGERAGQGTLVFSDGGKYVGPFQVDGVFLFEYV